MHNGMNRMAMRAMIFGSVGPGRSASSAIDRALCMRHRKPWQIKRINKRLASNGLRLINA